MIINLPKIFLSVTWFDWAETPFFSPQFYKLKDGFMLQWSHLTVIIGLKLEEKSKQNG